MLFDAGGIIMKPLQLDFYNVKQRRRKQSNIVLAVLLSLIALGLLLEDNQLVSQIADIEQSAMVLQTHKSNRLVQPTEQDKRKMLVAMGIRDKLNFPWHDFLNSLEVVKQDLVTVNLTIIQPNPAKREVLISGEAPDLKTMLAFVSLMEQQATFYDVLLVNQRRLESNNNNALAFTLKTRWEI